jgi:hypothetical protein
MLPPSDLMLRLLIASDSIRSLVTGPAFGPLSLKQSRDLDLLSFIAPRTQEAPDGYKLAQVIGIVIGHE